MREYGKGSAKTKSISNFARIVKWIETIGTISVKNTAINSMHCETIGHVYLKICDCGFVEKRIVSYIARRFDAFIRKFYRIEFAETSQDHPLLLEKWVAAARSPQRLSSSARTKPRTGKIDLEFIFRPIPLRPNYSLGQTMVVKAFTTTTS